MHGFFNKLLRINLTNHTCTEEVIQDAVLKTYMGGKGLGTYLLLTKLKPKTDPLSPENLLIFTTGCLTGTKMFGISRYGVYTRSPLTGFYGESYAGGDVAPMMKATGYDAFILEGASDKPVYLDISDKGVNFKPAEHLWGWETYKTEDKVKEEVGVKGSQAIVIGPAGENLVRFACIKNNYWRSAGRCGMGAVMGSKKVKALVFHGSQVCPLADESGMDNFVREFIKRTKNLPAVETYQTMGTPHQVKVMNSAGAFPTRYYATGVHPKWQDLSFDRMKEYMNPHSHGCHRCFLVCGKRTKITQGPYAGLEIEGPEFETIGALGGINELSTLEEVAYLNDLCDRWGIDTMTAGHMAGFAIEAKKRGKIKFDIEYGETEKIANFLKAVTFQEGEGQIFAKGIKPASKELGLEDIAIHVKGMEPALMDPRVLKGMGLAYAVSPRGACHLRSTFYKAELAGWIDRDQIEGKAKFYIEFEDKCSIHDTLVMCRFFRDFLSFQDFADLIKFSTGLSFDEKSIRDFASVIVDLTRHFNLREGLTKSDDTLPKRFFDEPLDEKKSVMKREDFDRMLREYYELRGWDENGIPKYKFVQIE